MKIVALVSQKGGSGKSTLAACLAVAAQEAGEKVFAIDLDPQQSLMGWGQARQAETPQVDTVPLPKLTDALTTLERAGYTFVIIDTAGADSPTAAAAMEAADFSLIPTRPSAFDIRACEKTRDALKTLGKPHAFVLNQCPPSASSSRAQDGARALELMGTVVAPFIVSRVAYQAAAVQGLGASEVHPPSPAAAEEMRALWGSVNKRLGGSRHG